ncbi:hypothetical protein BA1DRAFT_01867 [Photorhabdus aegyptia]|uniref:Uncharacterized protein n=1 Tax=Photorhabdus aegyptia TaxID=2805098 RepID=A0A022PM56_9GAMM|nr:hypothetical protein BA1DRAFT_01867 [Photorhabdus aegyptia]
MILPVNLHFRTKGNEEREGTTIMEICLALL